MKRNILINYVNGNKAHTDINGSDREIVAYYNDNNFLGAFSNEYVQIKSISIPVAQNELLAGQRAGTREYIFNYDDKAECYLY